MFLDQTRAETAILSRLRAMSPEQLREIRHTGEGLDRRLERCIRETATLEELLTALKTKRYPLARLRRLVLDSALEYGDRLPELPPYLHILAGRREALSLLKNASLPAGTSLTDLEGVNQAAFQAGKAHSRAEDLAALCAHRPRRMGQAYAQPPVLLD